MSLKQNIYRKVQQKWLKIYQPNATLPAHALDCPECGERVHIPKLRQGQEANCSRCGHNLLQIEAEPYLLPLATASAALIMMILVYSQMFVTVYTTGIFSPLSLPSMLTTLWHLDWGFLAIVMFLFTFSAPTLFLLLTIYVYLSLLRKKPLPLVLYAARAITRLRHWIMVDVFFISMLVAYIKISALAQLDFGIAFWLMPILGILLLRTSVAVSEHWVYAQIYRHQEHHQEETRLFQAASEDSICCTHCLYFRPASEEQCGVCGSELFNRRPYSLQISFCFLLAAAILYIPANVLPIMITESPIDSEANTIMSGIITMWQHGDKLIALVIFSASIAVPTLKIISMLILLYSAKFKRCTHAHRLSIQYRLTEAVGRWSMIDIFVIIILMSSFHSSLARVTPGPAAIYFCIVVLLTILSAYFFDVRLIWDQTRTVKRVQINLPINNQTIK